MTCRPTILFNNNGSQNQTNLKELGHYRLHADEGEDYGE